MDKYLSTYIEKNLIEEYAVRTKHGYRLDIVDLGEHEQENFISNLFAHDEITRDLIMDRAQQLINEQLELSESKKLFDNGFTPRIDNTTGEVSWRKAGGF